MKRLELSPKDHKEAVALFRMQCIASLFVRPLSRGELERELTRLAQEPVRSPGADITRVFSVPTLRRWYYRYETEGLQGLMPASKARGFGEDLTPEQRTLILEIRRQRPDVSACLLLRTLEMDGRVAKNSVSTSTVRRLLAKNELDRRTLRQTTGQKQRKRWQAEAPGVLWHADVCHGPTLKTEKASVPVRIHALLCDASRYVVALSVAGNEREVTMLSLLVQALRAHAPPRVLYLDNGSTYSGHALLTACGRLGIKLLHAKPYDPQARGKMERFWRTLREQSLDFMGNVATLHDVRVRLDLYLSKVYHKAPHGALIGRSPGEVWHQAPKDPTRKLSEAQLQDALTLRETRKVGGDSTVKIGGLCFEVGPQFLAGRKVTIGRSFLDPQSLPWIEHEDRKLELKVVDPVQNGNFTPRATIQPPKPGLDAIPFDPNAALLHGLLGGVR